MFNTNKYYKWYFNIVNQAKSRILPHEYTEKHHIIPKSLGGNNTKENLVILTAREHFICHLLLTKFTDGHDRRKMKFALNRMLSGKDRHIPNSRIYKRIREESIKLLSELNLGKKRSSETCKKISESRKGKGPASQSAEHIEKRRQSLIGKTRSVETKITMSKNRSGKSQSAEHIEKRRQSLIGKIRSEESKEKYRNSKTGAYNPNAKSITIFGKSYYTKHEACTDLDITKYELNKILFAIIP
jgi:hypothetical protein